jgi:hypothetical protein
MVIYFSDEIDKILTLPGMVWEECKLADVWSRQRSILPFRQQNLQPKFYSFSLLRKPASSTPNSRDSKPTGKNR